METQMRQFNPALLAIALVLNTVASVFGMAVGLVNTLELFLLIWVIPTLVVTVWLGILYQKSEKKTKSY
jgi:Mg2+ and Co2+ transporter CorA